MTNKVCVHLKGKYWEEILSQHKVKEAGAIDEIVKFIIYTKI